MHPLAKMPESVITFGACKVIPSFSISSWHSAVRKNFPCTQPHPFLFENPYGLGFFYFGGPSIFADTQILPDLASGSPLIHQFMEFIGLCVLLVYPNLSRSPNQLARNTDFPDWVTDQDLSTELAKVSPEPHRVLGRRLDT